MIKVLIVDDQAFVRQSMTLMLGSHPEIEVTDSASTGETALAAAKQAIPDVVLMDVRMPGIGGLEATRQMLALDQRIRVIGLTGYNDDIYPGLFMQAGAMGFVTKDNDLDEFVAAILSVHRGDIYLSEAFAELIARQRNGDADTENPFDKLAERERQVALLIAEGYKLDDIPGRLGIKDRAVRQYRQRAFKKLGVDTDVALTLLALQFGMVTPASLRRD